MQTGYRRRSPPTRRRSRAAWRARRWCRSLRTRACWPRVTPGGRTVRFQRIRRPPLACPAPLRAPIPVLARSVDPARTRVSAHSGEDHLTPGVAQGVLPHLLPEHHLAQVLSRPKLPLVLHLAVELADRGVLVPVEVDPADEAPGAGV